MINVESLLMWSYRKILPLFLPELIFHFTLLGIIRGHTEAGMQNPSERRI
jgi:hypothetical protein